MSNNPTFDASIPVLTEVFRDEPAKPPESGPGPADLTPLQEPEAPPVGDAVDVQALEQRLSERILQRLQEEILVALQPTMAKIVAEAVAQEMAHLHTLNK